MPGTTVRVKTRLSALVVELLRDVSIKPGSVNGPAIASVWTNFLGFLNKGEHSITVQSPGLIQEETTPGKEGSASSS